MTQEDGIPDSNKPKRAFTHGIIQESETITKNSDFYERFFRIKAIEEGGLPIDIVGITPKVMYEPRAAIKVEEGIFSISHVPHLRAFDRSKIKYFGLRGVIDIQIYYSTPNGQIYKGTFKQNRKLEKPSFESMFFSKKRGVLESLLDEVYSTVSSVNEIDRFNSIKGKFHANQSLTDGEIEVQGKRAPFDECERVNSISREDNADSFINFALNNGIEKYDENGDYPETGWIWAHISDIRSDDKNEIIYLIVETPFGKCAFPYNVNHDTDNVFWEIVGDISLTSIRGMDVCIRPRGLLDVVYKEQDVELSRGEFEKKSVQQPMETKPTSESPILIDGPTEINPVGVDIEYLWTLGIPPEGKNRTVCQDDNNKNNNQNKVFSKISSLF